jgi:hypothetical protein
LNFELNDTLFLKIKANFKWNSKEIALTFIHQYSHLSLSMSQIKRHLKHLDAQKPITLIEINIFQKKIK